MKLKSYQVRALVVFELSVIQLQSFSLLIYGTNLSEKESLSQSLLLEVGYLGSQL